MKAGIESYLSSGMTCEPIFSLAYDLSPNKIWQIPVWFTVDGDKKHQSSIKMILERYLISLKSMELCIK